MSPRAYFNEDTIAAPATAPHVAAPVGIIRVSGPQAVRAALCICVGMDGTEFSGSIENRRLYRCRFLDGRGVAFDEGFFVVMRAPGSFTGEDCVELHQHGNPILLSRMMESLVRTGLVRPAERGEFSFRAFRNGKMDLSQAEGVADLISSRTPRGAELALQSIQGCTKNSLENLKKRLVSALAEVEIEIDFSDQGLSRLDYSLWAERLRAWVAEVEKIRKGFLQSGPLRDGFRVAIVGAPNAGKSTLFNQLLGEDRSIVSEWAGTTRDVVRESFLVDGVAFSLSDTAGIRETGEAVEAQGIERSLGEIRSAHAVLLVIDAPAALLRGADEVSRTLSDLESRNFGAKTILVFNKADLLSEEELARGEAVAKSLARPLAVVSAKENKGLESLREQLLLALPPGTEELDAPRIGRTRHCELLGEAAERVGHAVRKVEMGETLPDLLASDLRGALDNLGQITGEVTTDDVLHHIFSEFCIGK